MTVRAETSPTAVVGADAFAGWRRNLLFVWIGVFVGLLGANFVFPFIPFYIRDLGITDKSQVTYFTGLSGSATGLSLTLTAPIWGALADRFGRKPMFLRALIGAGVLIALMGLVQAVWQLILLRFLMGAFAGTMGAAAALVAATTPREKVGHSLGLLQTGVFSANMLGPLAGGVVAASLGIRQSFIFCSALYLLAALLAYVFVREPKETITPPAEAEEQDAARGGLLDNLKVVVSERQVVLMLGVLFALWLSTTFVRPVMPISIDDFAAHPDGPSDAKNDRVHLQIVGMSFNIKEEAATGVLFGVIGLTSTIAAIAVAPLGQRLGYRNTVAGAAVITGALYMPVALAPSFTGFVLLLGAVGLFQGAMVPGTNALIAASTPQGKQGSAFGLAASMQSLALLVGPIGGGFVGGLLGIEMVYVVIGAILITASVVAFLFIREPELFESGLSARRAPGH